jgi:hypothetical protein
MFHSQVIPVSISKPSGTSIRETQDIFFHSESGTPRSTSNLGSKIKLYEGSPSTILEIREAFFVPGTKCLYNREGKRVIESCIRRGPELSELIDAGSDAISPPHDYTTVETPTLYLSWLPNHWGHFLTESISRLWARLLYPELATLPGFCCHMDNVHANILEFLHTLDLHVGSNIYTSDRAIKFKRIFIPVASFSNRGEAYSVHNDIFAAVTQHYLGTQKPSASDQPIVLSRSRFAGARTIERQNEFEDDLAQLGCRIIHPETLSLKEQITSINSHRIFIGCLGSAFHNMMFSQYGSNVISHLLCKSVPNTNFLMFDALIGNQANYVKLLKPVPGKPQVWPHQSHTIDIGSFMTYYAGARVQ